MASGIRDSGYAQLSDEDHCTIAIRMLRHDFLSQPPDRQRETLARVRQLLGDERRRKQNQPSYLMLHHEEIYGI